MVAAAAEVAEAAEVAAVAGLLAAEAAAAGSLAAEVAAAAGSVASGSAAAWLAQLARAAWLARAAAADPGERAACAKSHEKRRTDARRDCVVQGNLSYVADLAVKSNRKYLGTLQFFAGYVFMHDWVTTYQVREIDGQPCLVFTGASGGEVYFPANRTEAIFHDAMRQFNAYAAQHGVSAGQWRSAMIATPRTWNTGISDNGMAVIVVDRSLPSEQTFALLPEHAAALGKQLIQTTDQLGSVPPESAPKRKPANP